MSRYSLAFLSDDMLTKEGEGYNGSLLANQDDLKKRLELHAVNNVIKFPARTLLPVGQSYPRVADHNSNYLIDDDLVVRPGLRDSRSLPCNVFETSKESIAIIDSFKNIVSLDDDM